MMSRSISVCFCLALVFLLVRCSKNTAPAIKPVISISKQVVGIGEPLLATVKGEPSGTSIRWSTNPGAVQWISSRMDSAVFLFTRPGSYRISAGFASDSVATVYDSSSLPVTVGDSIYHGFSVPPCYSAISLQTNDHITIAPVSLDDSGGLVLLVYTRALYNNSPSLVIGGNFTGVPGYELDIPDVGQVSCGGSSLPAPAAENNYVNVSNMGDFPFSVNWAGKVFQGSLHVGSTSCTFTWSDTSSVTIKPLIINKK